MPRPAWQMSAHAWGYILFRAWINSGKKNLSLVAGGVAYYLLMALFPALAALVSAYCLLMNASDVTRRIQSLSGMLPASTVKLIGDELDQLVSVSSKSLSLGVLVGIIIALWSAQRGMSGMMTALNIAYDQPQRRGVVGFNVTALLLTVVVIAGGLIALMFIVVLPIILHEMGARHPTRWIGLVVEWPLLIVFAMGMVALIYRFGPDHDGPQWKWASPGVIVATILWVTGSSLFSFYVYHFNSYDKTYGSLGALLVVLTWLWLSVFVVLWGAEINGEAERHAPPEQSN